MTSSPGLWRQLWSLARAWWSDDRVRISPDEGKLLRLGVGAIIAVDRRPLLVTDRNVVLDGQGSWVAYRCDDGVEASELWVAPAGRGAVVIRRIRPGGSTALAPERVEVFG